MLNLIFSVDILSNIFCIRIFCAQNTETEILTDFILDKLLSTYIVLVIYQTVKFDKL